MSPTKGNLPVFSDEGSHVDQKQSLAIVYVLDGGIHVLALPKGVL
jgi:hypothetical protein